MSLVQVPKPTKTFKIFPQQFTKDLCPSAEMTDIGRVYTTDQGDRYSSITTMLSATMPLDKRNILANWRENVGEEEATQIATNAADRGSILHNMMEKYVFGQDYSEDYIACTPLNRRLFNQFISVLDNADNIRLIEKPLYSRHLKIAGRVDMICEWKGKLSIVDFKTSTRAKSHDMIGDYYLQELFYSICYAEHFGEKVENLVTIIATEKSLKPYVFEEEPKKHLTKLIKRVKEYHEIAH